MSKHKLRFFTLRFILILISAFFISFYSYNFTTYDGKLAYIFADTNRESDDLPESAIEISSAEALKNFLTGDEPYGYVIADISLDWDDVGAPVNFANGRTIDGRGHVLTLTDNQACADVYDDELEAFNLNGEGEASECNYGLFVSVNNGAIKNFKFAYSDEICAVNNGAVEINGVGIVCGENNGEISNCELVASGKFSYFYINGEADEGDGFQTHFGGFAGINSGRIDRVSASYYDFDLRVRTVAKSWDYYGDGMSAMTFAGGVIGNILVSGECTNSTIFGSDVNFNLTADKVGNNESCVYSGAIAAYSEGKIDNIIVDFSPEYLQDEDDLSFVSKNAVVRCGSATNVTALNSYGGGNNLRSSNCSCAEHKGYCNTIDTDRFTQAVVYIDEENNQVVELSPSKGLLESLSFTKLTVDNSDEIIADTSLYEKSPENFQSQNFAPEWTSEKTFHITPYQNSSDCFWEIKARSWQKVEIEFSTQVNFEHTGKDLLEEMVKLKPSDGESNFNCDFTKMNLTCNGENIYEAVVVGKYSLSIRPIEIGDRRYLYYDEENHILAVAPNDYDYEILREYYIVKNLVVTADWFEIEDNVKVYDGTDEFDVDKIKWDYSNENVMENFVFLLAVDYYAYYSQSDAGEDVEIIIELWAQEEEIYIVNQVSGVKGIIQRRKVNVTLDYAETTYGNNSIEYHYDIEDLIDNDVDIVFCSNISMPNAQEFRFWLEESEFGNYSIDNFDEWHGYENGAPIIMHKAIISQLVIIEEELVDLNTENVKDLQIKFRDVIDDNVFHILDIFYYNSDENDYMPIEGISAQGKYKIRLSIPKNLQLIYELDETLLEMEISVAQVDNTPIENNNGDNGNSSSELPKEHDDNKIEVGDNIGKDNSQSDYTEYLPSDVKEKSYGGIAIAVGATASSLIGVGILKRVLSKRKRK